eukprot:135192_1
MDVTNPQLSSHGSETPPAPGTLPNIFVYADYIRQHALTYVSPPPHVDDPSYQNWLLKLSKVETILHKKYMINLAQTIQKLSSNTTHVTLNEPDRASPPPIANDANDAMTMQSLKSQLNNLLLQQQASHNAIHQLKQNYIALQHQNANMNHIIYGQEQSAIRFKQTYDEQHWQVVALTNKNHLLQERLRAMEQEQKMAQCTCTDSTNSERQHEIDTNSGGCQSTDDHDFDDLFNDICSSLESME